MRYWLLCTMLSGSLATAQTVDTSSAKEDPNQQERERIHSVRQSSETRFSEAARLCYQQFDVNSCLAKAREARNETEADLKRQELTLNDAKRLQQGAVRNNEIEAKTNSEAAQSRADKAAHALERTREREQQAREKSLRQQKAQAEKAQAQLARDDDIRQRAAKQQEKTAQANEKREQQLQRQREASEHRASQASKQSAKDNEAAAPLPPASATR